jgi:hypothetical protein
MKNTRHDLHLRNRDVTCLNEVTLSQCYVQTLSPYQEEWYHAKHGNDVVPYTGHFAQGIQE